MEEKEIIVLSRSGRASETTESSATEIERFDPTESCLSFQRLETDEEGFILPRVSMHVLCGV